MELMQEQCLPACVRLPHACVGTMVASGGYDSLLNVYSDPSKPTPKLSLRVGIYIYMYIAHGTFVYSCWL